MSFGMRIEDGQIVSMQDGHMPNDFTGLEANRPTNPGVGDVYKETDTGKEYTCFVANIWSLTNSPAYEEYSNHTGAVDNVMTLTLTGNGTGTTDAANHEMDLSTSTGADSTATFTSPALVDPSTDSFEFNCKVKNIAAGANGTRFTLIGLANLSWGIYAMFTKDDDGNWRVYTADGTTTQDTAITALSSGDLLTIRTTLNKVLYFVNGVLVTSHLTATFTAFDCNLLVKMSNTSSSTVATSISVDYIGWRIYK